MKPKLFYLVRKAAHFARWEREVFGRWFELVDAPSADAALLSFGPDVLTEASSLPARQRFAVLFPGFSYNPVRNEQTRAEQLALLRAHFSQVFINPGPLEIAYRELDIVTRYQFSVDADRVGFRGPRTRLDSLLHVSHDNPQKDWQRSASVMAKTGLRFEVFPPRSPRAIADYEQRAWLADEDRRRRGEAAVDRLPAGYFTHDETIDLYHRYDGFVHVARDVRHPEYIDGKYTAAFIEAGVSGALLFWHDTWGLGNNLESVFSLPVDTRRAAARIQDIRSSVDIESRSRSTREEMLATFNVTESVGARARRMLELLDGPARPGLTAGA